MTQRLAKILDRDTHDYLMVVVLAEKPLTVALSWTAQNADATLFRIEDARLLREQCERAFVGKSTRTIARFHLRGPDGVSSA